jgi:hypothetical protein
MWFPRRRFENWIIAVNVMMVRHGEMIINAREREFLWSSWNRPSLAAAINVVRADRNAEYGT